MCTALWSHIRFHGRQGNLDREYVLLTTRTESGASDGKRSHRAFAVLSRTAHSVDANQIPKTKVDQ